MRRQVLSLLVENNPGVTSHISGLFSRRGYNIDSFSSGVTADPRYTRITIVASGDEQILEQIEKQLAQLIEAHDAATNLARRGRLVHESPRGAANLGERCEDLAPAASPPTWAAPAWN